MNKKSFFNALGIILAVLVIAAGLFVPAKLLRAMENDYISGEWSEVSIGEANMPLPSPTAFPETPSEIRLRLLLDYAASEPEFSRVGREYSYTARRYTDEELIKLVDAGALPQDVGWLIFGAAEISRLELAGELENSFLEAGGTIPSSLAKHLGLVSLGLWIVEGEIRGTVSIIADSTTGRIIDFEVAITGTEYDGKLDVYGILWNYASYLGLSAQEGFAGSVKGDAATISFGRAVVSLESRFTGNSTYFRLRARSDAASIVSSEGE